MTPRLATLWHSFTFRLTLAFMVFFCVSVAVLLAIGYWATIHRPLEQVEASIEQDARRFAALYGDGSDTTALVAALRREVNRTAGRQFYHMLVDSGQNVLSGNIPVYPGELGNGPWLRIEFELNDGDIDSEHEAFLRVVPFVDGGRLLVGRDTEDIDEREELITQVLGGAATLAAMLGLGGGLLLSLGVGRRIDAINRAAQRVLVGKMAERVPVRGTGDDFDRLSMTLNAMLDRIQALIASISRVSDNIAHELRTPLTHLRGDLELLEVAASRTGDDLLTTTATRARDDADRLQRIFDALLRIARIEVGRDTPVREALDLSTLLHEAVELYAPVAEQRRIAVTVAAPPVAPMRGDRHLLFQAICNLLDNALKYTPEGGAVTVSLGIDAGTMRLDVRDTGPGVPAEHRARLGERFFRADPASGADGHGLGLALVRAIARHHQGSLEFPAVAQGFIARLSLPGEPPAR